MRILLEFFFVLAFASSQLACAEDTTGSRFTSFAGFQLGELNLAAVQARLGKATLIESGDAGEYEASICYLLSDGVVRFMAGEMDGPEHDLGAFSIAKSSTSHSCSNWPSGLPEPDLGLGGLRFGMSESEFADQLGSKTSKNGEKLSATFKSRRILTKREFQVLPKTRQLAISAGDEQSWYDVYVYIEATFEPEGLRQIDVWKSETQ